MHILGIANGSIGGNSEVLLKAALTAATEFDSSITISWIHAPSVSIPLNPKPLEGMQDVSQGFNEGMLAGETNRDIPDDRRAILNAILDADGLVFATPTYSHAPAGMLKAVLDRILGPFTDVVFATEMLKAKETGDPNYANFQPDERLFKPRVAGFVAIGGSTTPDQFALALPTLHLLVYSLHAKVVDQMLIMGCGAPGLAVIKSNGEVLDSARRLGRNLASQLGKPFDDVKFLGREPPGACPYCHLTKIELFDLSTNDIGCTTCGAIGKLVVDPNGSISPVWDEDCNISSLTWKGKLTHIADLRRNGAHEAAEIKSDTEFRHKLAYWKTLDVPQVSLPSHLRNSK